MTAKFQGMQEVTIINHPYYTGATATYVTTNVETHKARIVLHHNWTAIKEEIPMWIDEKCLEAK